MNDIKSKAPAGMTSRGFFVCGENKIVKEKEQIAFEGRILQSEALT